MSRLLLGSIVFIAVHPYVVSFQLTPASTHNTHGANIHGGIATFQENNTGNDCKLPGQLYFAHIMKDGGESVNDYLQCLCEKHTCSIIHSEGPVHYTAGVQACEPTICTSHGVVEQRTDNCGTNFKNAKVFTVMRSPISRIVSLYHYHKDQGQEMCVKNTLLEVLQLVKSKMNSDHEWSDAMADWYFSNGEVLSLVHGEPSEELAKMPGAMRMRSATTHDVDRAKQILEGFDAIFFIESLEWFPALYSRSKLPLSQGLGETCKMPVTGASSKYPDPTDKEVELISSMNWADIELYQYAKNLPNRIS